MSKISILGGRVIDAASQLDVNCDVHIVDKKVVAIGQAPDGFSAEWTIDASNQIVCAGLVDLSVNLREPVAEQYATVRSETRAAAANGITTICCPPETQPVLDNPAVAELLLERAFQSGMAKVLPFAALTQGLKGQQLAELGHLRKAGCIATSNGNVPIENTEVLRHALEYATNCEMTVFLQPRDAWLGRNGYMHEGAMNTRMGLAGIPETTEIIEVSRILWLVELIGARVHFCRLSTAKAVQLIKEAQARGLPVSADVSAHHLFLTDMDLADYNANCNVYPPLRSQRDRDGLRTGLQKGIINAVCSDHQPHQDDAKINPFASTAVGISGLDTLLPLTLRLTEELGWDLKTALSVVTANPAKILGREDIGCLAVGKDADICIFDPNHEWRLSPEMMHSDGRNSPFLGWMFKGKVNYTLIEGKVVYNRSVI